MSSAPLNLSTAWDPLSHEYDPKTQEVIYYCASRLRAATILTANAAEHASWLTDALTDELVSTWSSYAQL